MLRRKGSTGTFFNKERSSARTSGRSNGPPFPVTGRGLEKPEPRREKYLIPSEGEMETLPAIRKRLTLQKGKRKSRQVKKEVAVTGGGVHICSGWTQGENFPGSPRNATAPARGGGKGGELGKGKKTKIL